jgi:hypothetical protein
MFSAGPSSTAKRGPVLDGVNPPKTAITDITVKESKSLASVDLLIGEDVHKPQWRKKDYALQTTLDPSQYISGLSCFTLRLYYRRQLGPVAVATRRHKDVVVDVRQLLSGLELEDGQTREIQQVYGKTEVVFAVQSIVTSRGGKDASSTDATTLTPTIDSIKQICPRFRILVIGKSGVGKSSLINKVFGVTKAMVSHSKPGEATIDDGITSDQNQQLILHDSRGFEPGEVDNIRLVRRFIETRSKQPHIKDRLHAVWLCLEIPCAGGRVMETGVEDFLDLKTSGQLGSIPVIAVFTKYDELIGRANFEIDSNRSQGLNNESFLKIAKDDAAKKLEAVCIKPFEQRVGDKVPHITVSTERGHEDKVDELVKLTFLSVEKHVASEPSIVSAMAQQASPSVKIDASIAIGKTKYWKGLASGTNFLGQNFKNCLEVIHVDIVTVWNFNDPYRHLLSTEFQTRMYDLVNKLANRAPPNPTRTLTVGLSMVGTIAGIVSALAGPAAPVVVPIAASAVLATWLYQVYKQSDETLRRLMAYIVDLTLIMQNLFWLAVTVRRPITVRLIKFVFKWYRESPEKVRVHSDISEYVRQAGVFDRAKRDNVLDKIVELIGGNRIESAEMHMHSLNGHIREIDFSGDDESWDVEM